MTQYLLGIELQALGEADATNMASQAILHAHQAEVSEGSQSVPIIKMYLDELGNYQFATGIEEIKRAILGIIPHLGSNYRHPLLFDVQILPGGRIDAYFASIDSSLSTSYPRLRKRIDRN